MARPMKEDRAAVRTTTLTIRLSQGERRALTWLAEDASATMAEYGIDSLTVGAYVRRLIRREVARVEARSKEQATVSMPTTAPSEPISSAPERMTMIRRLEAEFGGDWTYDLRGQHWASTAGEVVVRVEPPARMSGGRLISRVEVSGGRFAQPCYRTFVHARG